MGRHENVFRIWHVWRNLGAGNLVFESRTSLSLLSFRRRPRRPERGRFRVRGWFNGAHAVQRLSRLSCTQKWPPRVRPKKLALPRGGSQCCGCYAPFGVSGPVCVRGSFPTRRRSRVPRRRHSSTLPVREGVSQSDSTGLSYHRVTALQNSCQEAELGRTGCKEFERRALARRGDFPPGARLCFGANCGPKHSHA